MLIFFYVTSFIDSIVCNQRDNIELFSQGINSKARYMDVVILVSYNLTIIDKPKTTNNEPKQLLFYIKDVVILLFFYA